MNASKCIFTFFFLFVLSNLFAQQPGSNYKRCSEKTLNYEQGLLNNTTTDVITDENGYTWFSTITGMQRYNGYNLEQINPVVNGKNIAINSPVHFFKLKNGKIWISCVQGILEYSARNNSFKKIISGSVSPDLYYAIIPVYETEEGIFCFQKGMGIVEYNKEGHFLKSVFKEAEKIDSIVYSVLFLYKSPLTKNDQYLFVIHARNHIWRFNLRNNSFDDFICKDEILAITCSDQRLFILSKKALSSIYIHKMYEAILIPDKSIKMSTFSGRLAMGNKNQLLASNVNDLFEFDTSLIQKKEFITLTRQPVVATGFINDIYTDAFGRIWLLTNDDVKRIENTEVPFENFIYPNEKDNFIRSLCFDEEKHWLLSGGYEGLIQLYDTLANPLWTKSFSDADAGYILSIKKLSGNNYLLLTANKGLCFFNLSDKKIIPFQPNQKLIPDINFGNIIQKISDTTFYYTTAKNLLKCTIQKNKITSSMTVFSSDKPGGNLTGFMLTSDNDLWIGSTNGLVYFLKNGQQLITLRVPENYVIRCFAETADKKIWLGTDKGLYLFTNSGKLINIITRLTGLLNDCIYAILPNGNTSVFVSTNLGISSVDETGAIKNFSKELGLQESEFNTSAAIKTEAGRFYFGGVNGISAFYPAKFSSMKDNPVLNLTKFIVNDHEINTNFDTIVLKHFQNRLQFDLAALGLLNNTEYLYQYQLSGFDNTWQTTHNPTGIKYNLSPGTFTLKVVCSAALSKGNLIKKNIVIIIKIPWWKSWWFLTIAILFLIGAVAFIVYYYNHRKYIQKIRALELQHQLQQERERISRELHDNIGAQISFISSNSDWLIDKSQEMNKNDELEQLKEINLTAKNVMMNLRETIWTLHKEEITLLEFFDKLKAYVLNILHLKPGIV
ncbi:MAG: histidine kinase, partial [Ginsengibacter sp.]